MKRTTSRFISILALVVSLFFAHGGRAPAATQSLLVEFSPDSAPAAGDPFEFRWENPGSLTPGTSFFDEDTGSTSSGDGATPSGAYNSSAVALGLDVFTPFTVPGAATHGGEVLGDGSTQYADASIELSGFPDAGPVILTPIFPGFTQATQPLGNGLFEIHSTTDPDADPSELLLSGFVEDAVITGALGFNTGAGLSATVTYTGGSIFDASGFSQDAGPHQLSISLLNITPSLSVAPNGRLASFQPQATGQLLAVPEPSAGLLALAGLALLAGWIRIAGSKAS